MEKMNHLIDIIIPSFNNPQYLGPCVTSILKNYATPNLCRIIIVNNGDPESINIDDKRVTVIHSKKNLGWEGGLKRGLEESKAEFVVFMNDDTYIPTSSRLWLNTLLQNFKDPSTGAVGPSSNVVMGSQNIFVDVEYHIYPATFLIGFCMMLRRSALDKAGGIDAGLPGGDDFDLSIRLRKAGYRLLVDRTVFVYHHGFTTGNKVHGDYTIKGGWNSFEFKSEVDTALIQKHGFKEWWNTINGIAFILLAEKI